MCQILRIRDIRLSAGAIQEYRLSTTGSIEPVTCSTKSRGIWDALISALSASFLPQGYPDSVAEEYLSFRIWDAIQSLANYLRNLSATSASLKGLGVGSANAAATSAAISWMWRDGVSCIVSIAFTARFSSAFAVDPKRWRLFADACNSFGAFLIILTLFLPNSFFFPMYVGASVFYGIAGVAAGATGTAFREHFAKKGNVVDLSAKDGTQNSMVSLFGLLLSTVVPLPQERTGILIMFLALTTIHSISNWRMVHFVKFRSLNMQRTAILCQRYKELGPKAERVIVDPAEVSSKESVLGWTTPDFRVGLPIHGATGHKSSFLRSTQHFQGCWRVKQGLICEEGVHRYSLLAALVTEYIDQKRVENFMIWARRGGWDVDDGLICVDEGYRIVSDKSE